MRNRMIGIISFIFAGAFTCFLLVTAGYFYLNKSVTMTEKNVSDVPYTFSGPENNGILLKIGGNSVFMYLDFEEKTLNVVFPSEDAETAELLYGYPIDYTVEADNTFLAELIDILGGIEMNRSGESLRYTGVQVREVLERTPDEGGEFKTEILRALLTRIAENGLTVSDIKKLIAISDTNLTVPDCYDWAGKLQELCQNPRFINQFGD